MCLSRVRCHPLSPVCLAFAVSLSLALCPPLSVSASLCVCVCVCVRAHTHDSVCLSVSPSRRLPVCLGTFLSFCLCLSRQLAACPFLWPRPLTGAMALAEELAPAGCLPSRGCVRVSGRLSVCLSVAHLLSQEGRVLGGRRRGKGSSVGRRGGAEALQSTALVAHGGLGTGQGPGRMGAQGPGWAAPRPAGGSEARASKPDTSRATLALSSERDAGRPAERGRAWRGPGREGAETSAPLTPPPRARTHALPLGVPEALRPPGPTKWLLAAGWRCSGAWRLWQAEGSCGSSTARAPIVRCGRLARLACPTCQSEREAHRRAFRAPGGSRLRLPPYHPAHPISRFHI